MIDKPLYIIIFMYCASVGLIGAQWLADSMNLTLINQDGQPLKSSILEVTDVDNLNVHMANIVSGNSTAFILDAVVAGSTIAWELFQIVLGIYIFNILIFFGVPPFFVYGIVIVYVILLANFIIAKIRGV